MGWHLWARFSLRVVCVSVRGVIGSFSVLHSLIVCARS